MELLIGGQIRVQVLQPASLVAVLAATYSGVTVTMKGASQMAYTLPADKMVELRISYVDANNNPASIDGMVEWDSSDEEVARVDPLSVNPTDDNSAVILIPGTKVGNCQISAKADADMGEGVRELVTLMDVTVVGGEAVSGTIEPGEPVDKP